MIFAVSNLSHDYSLGSLIFFLDKGHEHNEWKESSWKCLNFKPKSIVSKFPVQSRGDGEVVSKSNDDVLVGIRLRRKGTSSMKATNTYGVYISHNIRLEVVRKYSEALLSHPH